MDPKPNKCPYKTQYQRHGHREGEAGEGDTQMKTEAETGMRQPQASSYYSTDAQIGQVTRPGSHIFLSDGAGISAQVPD